MEPRPQSVSIPQALELALGHHHAGQLQEAERIYRKVLEVQPEHAEALDLLGVLEHQSGRNDVAHGLIERAVRLAPSNPDYLSDLGTVRRALGRFGAAEQSLRAALAIDPNSARTHHELGNVQQGLGHTREAIQHYRRALAIDSRYADAHNNLGAALASLGEPLEAERSFREALALRPEFPESLCNLGSALRDLGRLEEAEQCLRQALTQRPDYPEALGNLGFVLHGLGRFDEAEKHLRRALALNPGVAEVHNNLGYTLNELGRFGDAEPILRRAIELKPDFAEAHSNLGHTLNEGGRYGEAERFLRRAIELKPEFAEAHLNLANSHLFLGRFDESERHFRQALALKPDYFGARSNLIFLLDLREGRETSEQQAERQGWYVQFARSHGAAIRPHENQPDPLRRLRIGYMSADFRVHSAYMIFAPVLCAHKAAGFEVYCYSGVTREDDATARLKQSAKGWRSTVGVSDDALAEQIRSDGIDILVDLSGHSEGNRLLTFARKPAPVQVTAWGHATGTGLETIDYFLADPVLVPPAERALYAEEVLDLPCCVCYEAPEYLPVVSGLPVGAGKAFTFGCINRPEKFSGRVIGLWARILRALPQARLMVKAPALEYPAVRERHVQRFVDAGIGPDRLQVQGRSPHAEHLKIYQEVDLGLDPYPHGGGVSTLEALWMGVPVVTLKGSTAASRLSASILAAAEMPEWIAHSDEEYVRIAVEAAQDLPRLADLRQGLRARMNASVIGDTKAYTRAVEAAYRSMWRRWCERITGKPGGAEGKA